METKIFVDTSALIALFNSKDQCHSKATIYFEALDPNTVQFHTSNYIIDETITRIRVQDGHHYALEFCKHFFTSKIFHVHYIEKDIEKAALELFKKYFDKELSFTDCTSFALMKQLKIKKAFTFDDDFIKVGFEIDNPID
ncbi:MAG: PIN domain-containing protein [Enterobacteriaceae bacterium]|nr:PIN domain-containing protein [Enterobacteriaceae bacterium]